MKIIVPRLVDEANFNAQNLNARSMLSHFSRKQCEWHCAYYGKPDPAVSANCNVRLTRLAPWRAWPWHMALFYQQSVDAIFYPGLEWYDQMGLRWRDCTRRSIPVVATIEGLAGGLEREQRLSRIAGHPVYCHRVPRNVVRSVDDLMHRADHIVAISPFLARMARELYGDKCSVLSMGVDADQFAPVRPKSTEVKKVISVGNVRAHKRPEVFLGLAERFRDVQFCWIGEGDQRIALATEAAQRGLRNLSFPGPLQSPQIAEELRTADVFVMPSRSEGVPKVTQEAAAAGLAQIVFGFYEAPSVVDGVNGFVVWSDEEMAERLATLLADPGLVERFGRAGTRMAEAWSWDVVAPQWERLIIESVDRIQSKDGTRDYGKSNRHSGH